VTRRTGVGTADRERGSAALELAIGFPAVLLLVLVLVAAGRWTSATSAVSDAARQAARAASLERNLDPDHLQRVADAAARRTLDEQDLRCAGEGAGSAVRVTASLRDSATTLAGLRQQEVRVSVTCAVRMSDLGIPGFPGRLSAQRSSTSVIDVLRGD